MSNLPNFGQQIIKFQEALSDRLQSTGTPTSSDVYTAALPILEWLNFLKKSEVTGTSDELLDGVRASVVETVGCLAAGMVRPAIFSLRGQIDLALAWLFFKDHPVEWDRVGRTGDGFKLHRESIEYLDEYGDKFKNKLGALFAVKTRKESDPYRLLSSYVHSQSPHTVPVYMGLETLIWTQAATIEAVKFQWEVSEYLNDVFLSYFSSKWASLPKTVVENASKRLGKDVKKVFF